MKYLLFTTGMATAVIVLLWLLCWLWQLWKFRDAVEMANSIPLEHCRRIPGNCDKSEADLELLRDQLYAVARVAVEAYTRQRRGNGAQKAPDACQRTFDGTARVQEPSKPAGFHDALAMVPEEDRYDVEERGAIMEFDGGLDRDAADRAAFSEYCRAKRGN